MILCSIVLNYVFAALGEVSIELAHAAVRHTWRIS